MALSNMLIHSLPQNEFYTDLGINFIQQRDVREEGRANTMFLGRTLDYTAESLEESVWKLLLREDGLLTGMVNKCEVLKGFL